MSSFKCAFCGSPLSVPDTGVKTIVCPNCMGTLPLPSEPVGDGPLAELPNAQKGFPFIHMLLVAPLAILFLGVLLQMWLSRQWGAAAIAVVLGGTAAAVLLIRMRGRWTLFRVLWIMALSGVWVAANYHVGMRKQWVQRTFAPVQTEFAGYVPPPSRVVTASRLIKLKLFPLILHGRGKTRVESNAPTLPISSEDFKLYEELPPTLKAANAAEVQSVVVVNWGWDATTRAGTCDITVVERKTRMILAATKLTHADTSAEAHGPDWRGVQPSVKEVLSYLEKLGIEAERTPQPEATGTD